MSSARERWKALVEALEASSLSTAAFAEQAGVNRHTLAWWRWKLRIEPRSADRSPFAELIVAEPVGTMRLHVGRGDAFVDVDGDTDLALVRRLLEALC